MRFLPVKLPPLEGTGILSNATGLYSVVVVIRCAYSSMRSCSAKSLTARCFPSSEFSATAYRKTQDQIIINIIKSCLKWINISN